MLSSWLEPGKKNHISDIRQVPCDSWQMIHNMWQMKGDSRHVTSDMWQVTLDMWHMIFVVVVMVLVLLTAQPKRFFVSYIGIFFLSKTAQAHGPGSNFFVFSLKGMACLKNFFRVEPGSGSTWLEVLVGLWLGSEWIIESKPGAGSARTEIFRLGIACYLEF